jgi:S-adenosylmethionine decarboxylase proenzyme
MQDISENLIMYFRPMVFKSSPIGNEISCVGLSEEILNDGEKLKTLLLEGLKRDNFRILEVADHKFQPQGYTCCVLLAESHAAIHTYPEYNSLVFYLYSCREEGDGKKTFEFLKEKLNPKSIDFKERVVKVEQQTNF